MGPRRGLPLMARRGARAGDPESDWARQCVPSGPSCRTLGRRHWRRRAKASALDARPHAGMSAGSPAPAQLAARLASVMWVGRSKGGDRCAKIVDLISDVIATLEREAEADATEKAYCDDRRAKTEVKGCGFEDDISRMTSRLDRAKAKSVQWKEEIKVLETELGALMKDQAAMDKIRQEEDALRPCQRRQQPDRIPEGPVIGNDSESIPCGGRRGGSHDRRHSDRGRA